MKVHQGTKYFNLKNKTIVLTPGTFDGVHIGHQKIISRVKELADKFNGESVLLTFNPHPRHVLFPDDNKPKFITTIDEKIEQLEKHGVDHLIIYPFTKEFSRFTATQYVRDLLVNEIGVNKLVIGYDHQFGKNREGNFESLMELSHLYGFEVEEIPAQDIDDVKVSSTKIRNALAAGEINVANDYLGYNFSFSGLVVKGKQLGRAIGFPTANIQVQNKYKILPGKGAYAVFVYINGNKKDGMLNVGNNPTTDNSNEIKLEVNIFNFADDLYEKEIRIEIISKIRNEIKFDSLDNLKEQLRLDKIKTLNILH